MLLTKDTQLMAHALAAAWAREAFVQPVPAIQCRFFFFYGMGQDWWACLSSGSSSSPLGLCPAGAAMRPSLLSHVVNLTCSWEAEDLSLKSFTIIVNDVVSYRELRAPEGTFKLASLEHDFARPNPWVAARVRRTRRWPINWAKSSLF